MITEKDFGKVIVTSRGDEACGIIMSGDLDKDLFELAKKMAVGFAIFVGNKGYRPADQSYTYWKRALNQITWSEPITTEQLLELYLKDV